MQGNSVVRACLITRNFCSFFVNVLVNATLLDCYLLQFMKKRKFKEVGRWVVGLQAQEETKLIDEESRRVKLRSQVNDIITGCADLTCGTQQILKGFNFGFSAGLKPMVSKVFLSGYSNIWFTEGGEYGVVIFIMIGYCFELFIRTQ